jgi:hypothetical protein
VSYSPHLRTAVLLSGSGTGGAYHAGVLRALHEAGVKIDVMSGRGVGIVGALFAAIDAAPRTWEDGGVWRRRPPARLYRWRPALQWGTVFALLGVAVLAVPLLVVATGLIVYPLSFLVQMVSVDTGYRLVTAYAAMVEYAFSAAVLPTVIPRLVTLCLAAAFTVLAIAAIGARGQRRAQLPSAASAGHRDRGHWWGRLLGSPWSAEPGLRHFRGELWHLFRASTGAKPPSARELSRRYAELLLENLGQPGFRDLIVTTLDLETRRDLIFAALGEGRRQDFFRRGDGEFIDVAGVGRSQILEALAGAMSVPLLTDPHPVVFSPESYWKGETHRTCDRVAAVGRLLHELATSSVEQVIIVSADADRAAPHRLSRPAGTLEARLAEHLSAAEASAVRDAVAAHSMRFRGVFLIRPTHNPLGPLDFDGTYDERSDRYQSLEELVDRGYEDAYRQFIEPVVGAPE